MIRSSVPLLLAVLATFAPPASAQTARCAALPDRERALVRTLFDQLHPYDGCDRTFATCLEAKPRHPLVTRLADDLCRLAAAGKGREEIVAAYARRARSMVPMGPPASIAADPATFAGDPAAPVLVTVYACTRCPYCKVLVPALHREVTSGTLRGKVRLSLRPFPLRDHPGSTEGGLAILAAGRQGAFWPFLLDVYARYDGFDPTKLGERAGSLGLSRERFEAAVADPAIREALVESKREGVRNRVTETPAVFIDGLRYGYDLDLATLVDVLEEAHERRVSR